MAMNWRLSVFKRFGMYLGIGLANLINLIDPQIIVITWRSREWLGSVCGMRCIDKLSERAFRATAQQVKIARAECGDNAGLFGAARLALQDSNRNLAIS